MDAATAELKRRGAQVIVEPKTIRPGVRIAFIQGPDHVRIELLERTVIEVSEAADARLAFASFSTRACHGGYGLRLVSAVGMLYNAGHMPWTHT